MQWEVVRPGATRLNLSWFSSEAELEFVLGALELVAGQGWRLLHVYRFNNETGEWRGQGVSAGRGRHRRAAALLTAASYIQILIITNLSRTALNE